MTKIKHQIDEQRPQQKRLTWHKPSVQRLHLSLDTALSPGSGVDGFSISPL